LLLLLSLSLSLLTHSGIDTIVGTNKYRLEQEDEVDVLQIDNSAVRLSQIARLKELRANRNEDEVQAALSALTASAQSTESTGLGENPHNLMHLAINAARVRCTLGKKGVW
jgi:methylmalonyl-CoA mutase